MINQPYADDLGQGEQQFAKPLSRFFFLLLLDLQDTTTAGNRKGSIKEFMTNIS